MSKFTSGKWEVVRGAGNDEFDVISEEAPLHNFVCVLFGYPTSRWEEQKANARLIAAAPEMYDWIETTCRFLHDLKRYAQDEDEMRAHAEDMNTTYNDLLCKAYLMLGHIDGEEASDA